ncbi:MULTISPECIES: TolC family protein [Stenotrophomonas]|jgi:cobalt-zinc-cadmium efflux system outer membrane protein|uniref:TolC family protein n=1 Tax=Stenotrophomonas TaxID=40323 RepID=UPI0024DF00B2|nr:TolC family protein [Stenotrophomonas sp. BIO128-Bstrain]WIA63020.1 TolC family protein [Stenotrophomonas sp. BIO128-Bstrain]
MNTTTRCAALIAALMIAPATVSALTLAEAERVMAQHNPDLLAAAIELRGTQGDAQSAARRPSPELSVGTSKISRQEGIGPGRWKDKRVDSTLGLGWTWERGGKRGWRMRQADALVEAAQLSLLDGRRQQQVALREAYFGLKAAQELSRIAEEDRRASAESLAAADRQVATGAIALIERARLAVDDLKVADAAREAALGLREARHVLALLLGSDADEALRADDAWPRPASAATAAMATLDERVDLRAAEARVIAADAARALARSERRRDVQFGIEAEREPADIGGVTWGLSMSVPLGGATRWRGEQQRAEADYDAAVLERQQLRREAAAELDQLRHALAAAAQRRTAYEQLQGPAARKSMEGLELAYRRGAATLTDLLDARRSWREFESDLVDARLAHASALARWNAAISVSEGHTP